jgi:GT2 family glycosyltransferase
MPYPLISLIIVNYNGKHHLEECLPTIFAQTYPNFEVILVDNGSADGSNEFIEAQYSQIKLVKLSENTGFCKGNNIGLTYAKGKFITLLNNDTVTDQNWLKEIIKPMLRDEQVGLCASLMINYYNCDVVDTAGDGYDICGVGYKIGEGEPVENHQQKKEVFGACAGAALYRKSMIEKIGFFDEMFFAYGEDIDLSFRAKLAGYKCIYVPKAIVFHKVNQTMGTKSDFLVFHTRRNIEYTYFNNMPFLLLLLLLPFHILYNILTLIEALYNRKLSLFISSKFIFLKNLKFVFIQRWKVQKQRKISQYKLFKSFSKGYIVNRLFFNAKLFKKK